MVPDPVIPFLQFFPTFLVTIDYRDVFNPPPRPSPRADLPMADLCHDCGPRGQGVLVQEMHLCCAVPLWTKRKTQCPRIVLRIGYPILVGLEAEGGSIPHVCRSDSQNNWSIGPSGPGVNCLLAPPILGLNVYCFCKQTLTFPDCLGIFQYPGHA